MPDALQIRLRLSEWIDGRISLSEFEDWFVPETWSIHMANDPEAEDLTDEIELTLSEYSGGHLSIALLKDRLKELAHVAHPFAAKDLRDYQGYYQGSPIPQAFAEAQEVNLEFGSVTQKHSLTSAFSFPIAQEPAPIHV
jgi:hypothetical protein